jgi:hypothetical protein
MNCIYCDKHHTTIVKLRKHQRLYCTGKLEETTNYKCKYCEKYYSSSSNLKQHQKVRCKIALDMLETSKQITVTGMKRKKICIKKKSSVSHVSHDIDRNKRKCLLYVDDFILETLTKSMGKIQASDFLLTNFLNGNFNKIIEKSYLDVVYSDEYPMACNSRGVFYYTISKNKRVRDPDGMKLVNVIVNNIQNAVLKACNIQIKKYLGTGDIGPLYDIYDIGKIQSELCNFGKELSKRKLKKYLSQRVMNPNHKFFPKNID